MARGVLPGRQVLLPRCGRLAWRRPCDSARALIYGADCAVLLGAVPALADVLGGAGLVFIDGHEDATTMEDLRPARPPTWRWPSCWACGAARYVGRPKT